jgi:hypothetical protein
MRTKTEQMLEMAEMSIKSGENGNWQSKERGERAAVHQKMRE